MGTAGLEIDVDDTVSSARLNQKTRFIGTGAQIAAIGTTYPGMRVFCTSTGSGFFKDKQYVRNSADTAWIETPVSGQSNDQLYPLSTTIGDYSIPSAAVASSAAPTTSIDFSSETGWTKTGTKQNIAAGVLNWEITRETTVHSEVYDFGSALNDVSWEIRFKMVCSTKSANTNNTYLFVGMSSTLSGDNTTAQDFIGFQIQLSNTSTSRWITTDSDGAAVDETKQDTASTDVFDSGETRYLKLSRLTATTYQLDVYSDSAYSTLIESISGTCAATVTSLRYFKVMGYNTAALTNSTMTGTIDDLELEYNSARMVLDNETGTKWESASENNPNIYIDTGSAQEVVAIALNIDKTTTTETEVDIRYSTDTTFTSGEDVRSLLISDFTDDTWRFIQIPRQADDRRYIQIRGVNTSKVLAINEIKYRVIAAATIDRAHYHKYIDPTSTDESFDDSD